MAVFLENTKSLVTRDQLAAWCGPATRVVIKPVIDLHDQLTVSGYAIPDRLAEHAFDPDGPDGQTSTCNLACLCRRHHRLKTHGEWTYTVVEPGTYLWRSPLGYRYLVDASGTRDLTPRPVDPPG